MTNFVYYYWYEWTRAAFEKAAEKAGRASKKLTTVEAIIAGAIAGSATVLLTNPIWVINTRMTARRNEADDQGLPGGEKPKKSKSTIQTLLDLLKNEPNTSIYYLWAIEERLGAKATSHSQGRILSWRNRQDSRYYHYLPVYHCQESYARCQQERSPSDSKRKFEEDYQRGGIHGSLQRYDMQSLLSFSPVWQFLGIVPKVTQSAITAAFLFAFKDVLYDVMVAARRRRSIAK